MASKITQYDLLLSCPSDITESERDEVNKAIEEFNEMYSDTLNLSLRLRQWKKSSFTQSGGNPQDLLNKQFIHNCDAAIAIFWTRFGTPTDKFQSGTEEEIEYMLDSNKQVFMYFSEKQVRPSDFNNDEYQKVIKFKKDYANKGIYGSYSSENELKKIVFAHLSKYFLTKERIDEIEIDMKPNLSLVGIDEDNNLSDIVKLLPFRPYNNRIPFDYDRELLDKFNMISDMKIDESSISSNGLLTSNKLIRVDDNKIEFLIKFAEFLGLQLEEEFFNVGNLRRNTFASTVAMLGGGDSLEGDDSEIKKYNLINGLYQSSSDYLHWLSFTKEYSKLNCVKLAVLNNGKSYDEDIEITLKINKNAFISLRDFPEINEDIKQFLLDEYDLSHIFGISETLKVKDYESSIKTKQHVLHPQTFDGLFESKDYNKMFNEYLDDAFIYSIYETEDHFSVILNFEYVKHNNAVAFPTVLFLKNEISNIEYEITSKFYPDKINGHIKTVVQDKVDNK